MAFFEGCPVGWGGGYPPELAWWTGGVGRVGLERLGGYPLELAWWMGGEVGIHGAGLVDGVREAGPNAYKKKKNAVF